MDQTNPYEAPPERPIKILSEFQFAILCIFSLGLYEIWWLYKTWRYYKEKKGLDVIPVLRTLFSLFFLHGLLTRILESAKEKYYTEKYSPTNLFILWVILNVISLFISHPDQIRLDLFGLFTFVPLIPAFKAFNYYLERAETANVVTDRNFEPRHYVLMGIGAFLIFVILKYQFAEVSFPISFIEPPQSFAYCLHYLQYLKCA